MAIIPVMVRMAPRLGMIDRPDPRKVHVVPIPRAGGIGIVLGALVPIAMWLPMDALTGAYLFGAMVLLFFGVWDDICELGHYVKFIGQLIAAIAVVYYGDLYVTNFPFIDGSIPESIGKPFTIFALMGMINAINHSDGLDGLAGGMSMLSLGCMSYLTLLSDGGGFTLTVIALATLGGVFGFLRYNTHPARVFMGDGGSQFLGFTLGFLVVYLIEEVNPALSPALPALVLGLPIVDILAVFAQRIYHGMNWFRASKNHIHHRLLEIGFDHYESVVVIYTVQVLLVVSAIFLKYDTDLVILFFYASVCSVVLILLTVSERYGWRIDKSSSSALGLGKIIRIVKGHNLFTVLPARLVTVTVAVFFMFVAVVANAVPYDLGIASAALAAILMFYLVFRGRSDSIVVQAIVYVLAAFSVYLATRFISQSMIKDTVGLIFFVTLAFATGIAVRFSSNTVFNTTPMDFLVIIIVLFAGFLLQNVPTRSDIGFMVTEVIILFYSCELIYSRGQRLWRFLNITALAAMVVLAVRGLV